MKKVLDLNKKVAELVGEYPEIKPIMVDLGFKEITSPAALKLMGRVMTIPKGSAVKGIPMEKVVKAFEDAGFRVIGYEGAAPESEDTMQKNASSSTESDDLMRQVRHTLSDMNVEGQDNDRVQELKSMIERLSKGEDLESVRADFVKDFSSVSVHEIADAEQSLINDGMPVGDVQKLCDIHSALFHGMTEEEVWLQEEKKNAEKGTEISSGHPIDYFHQENAALEKLLKKTRMDVGFASALSDDGNSSSKENMQKVLEDLTRLKKVRLLYGKKEESVMPVLERYGIDGPTNVMWGVDDEIKQATSRFAASLARGVENETSDSILAALKDDILSTVKRMEEMIYKEEKILYPLAQEHFTDDEWVDVYSDIPEMGPVFIDAIPKWQHGEEVMADRRAKLEAEGINGGKVQFELGSLTVPQIRALFDALPLDITFIDENDINTFFSNNGKVFSRPKSALGRKVYDCHPARIRPVVEQLIGEFKAGTRDSYERWIPMRAVKITYKAVRDENGKFLGTLELVQDFSKDKKALKISR